MSDSSVYGESGLTASATAIKNTLTDIGNLLDQGKIVYFYCNHGQDRTGTIACLIELICGCDFESIIKDYELSCFHASDLTNATPVYNGKLWSSIQFIAGKQGDTLNDKCVTWLKSIGVTQTTIDKIRNNMIVSTPILDLRLRDEPCKIAGYLERAPILIN